MMLRTIVFVLAAVCTQTATAQTPDGKGPRLPVGAIARFGSERMRHPDDVMLIDWSADQKQLATRTSKEVYLWDVETGRRIWQRPLEPGQDWYAFKFARGNNIVTHDRKALYFFDQNGKPRYTLTRPGSSPWSCEVSPNGKRLVVVWNGGPSIVYDLTDKGPIAPGREITKGIAYAPQFSEDGDTFIYTTTSEVETWDLKKFVKIRTYQAHDHPVYYHTSRISP